MGDHSMLGRFRAMLEKVPLVAPVQRIPGADPLLGVHHRCSSDNLVASGSPTSGLRGMAFLLAAVALLRYTTKSRALLLSVKVVCDSACAPTSSLLGMHRSPTSYWLGRHRSAPAVLRTPESRPIRV